MNKNEESKIVTSICVYLKILENKKELYFFRNNSFQGTVLRKNGSRGYIRNNKKGVADIFVLKNGKSFFLEVKSETGRQSTAQKLCQSIVEQSGGYYFIVRSVDDVIQIFKKEENI